MFSIMAAGFVGITVGMTLLLLYLGWTADTSKYT